MKPLNVLRPLRCAWNVGLLALLVAGGTTGLAQTYSIPWFKIAGGGATTPSTGGVYAVSGTIGQPDAGSATGGPYAVDGGFWAGVLQTPGAPPLSAARLANGNVRVFWSLTATNFVLDQTSALAPTPAATVWTQVPFPYQTNASQISITITSPSGNKIYRLRKP